MFDVLRSEADLEYARRAALGQTRDWTAGTGVRAIDCREPDFLFEMYVLVNICYLFATGASLLTVCSVVTRTYEEINNLFV